MRYHQVIQVAVFFYVFQNVTVKMRSLVTFGREKVAGYGIVSPFKEGITDPPAEFTGHKDIHDYDPLMIPGRRRPQWCELGGTPAKAAAAGHCGRVVCSFAFFIAAVENREDNDS
jgi:hypothetical protein